MKQFVFVLGVIFVLFGSSVAQAGGKKYLFDQPHTQVLFFIDHMGFAKSQGEFEKKEGYILLDEAMPEKAEIYVNIPISSLDMDDLKWEEHLKGPDFFDVEKSPAMIFQSTSVQRTGDKTALMSGDLTLRGVTKPVTLSVTHNKSGKHPMNGKDVVGFSATGTLKRPDFGMNYGPPMVGDEVELRIEVEAHAEDLTGTNAGNE